MLILGSKSKLEVPDEVSVIADEDGIETDHEKEVSDQDSQHNTSIDSVKPNNMTDPKKEDQSSGAPDHNQDTDEELSGAEMQHDVTEPPASSSPPPQTHANDEADAFFD